MQRASEPEPAALTHSLSEILPAARVARFVRMTKKSGKTRFICELKRSGAHMRIIVIGAGIGGLSAALTLRRAGLEVQVFEQAAELREVGAGIQISPNASRILNRLGLEEPMRRAGVRPRSIVIRRWDDGRELARQPLADACERNFGAPYYNFHRADLLDLLSAAVPAGVLHLESSMRRTDPACRPSRGAIP